MKVSYDRDEDILLIELSKGKIDFAEEKGPLIVHFSKKREPLLLEILHASEVLSKITETTIRSKKARPVTVNV